MSRPIFIVLILLAAVVAAAFRLPGLEQRPMHGDEAVNAFKLGETLERRGYEYDPHEYHGPTLNYLALIFKSVFTILVFFDTALQAVARLGVIFVQRSLGCQAPTAESCIT